MTKRATKEESTAPEGGWGWYVVLGYAMNNMVVLPLLQIFGLLYHDILRFQLQLTSFQISVIIYVNISCGMLLAIFNGPILRYLGYRKVAIIGSLLVFFGNYLTSRATSFEGFLIYFSVIVSIGTNFVMAAFNLALNTYFVAKRGVATGIAMSITGLGPILMPLLTSLLISIYGIRGTGMILAALTLHSLAAAFLLQPVKWHRRKAQEAETVKTEFETAKKNEKSENLEMNDINSKATEDHDKNEREVTPSTKPMDGDDDGLEITPSTKLMDGIDDGSDQRPPEVKHAPNAPNDEENPPLRSLDDIVRPQKETFGQGIVRFFDLDLLHDPIYLNISCGLALAFVSEMSFTIMLPILVQDRNFDKDRTAWVLSTLAMADILSRFTSPLIGNSLKSKVRVTYVFSLISGIFFRELFILFTSFGGMLCVIILLGVTKGIRSVYTALVIPSYVPLNKLASASGLQMVLNGIMLGLCGPLFGKVRDASTNYNLWIHVINCFTLVTIILWGTEMFLIRRKRQQKKPIVRTVER